MGNCTVAFCGPGGRVWRLFDSSMSKDEAMATVVNIRESDRQCLVESPTLYVLDLESVEVTKDE